jgi:PAS domain S-box-containing protein
MAEVLLRIIEELADGFLVINEEGKIVFFNEVFLKTTGLRSNDILVHENEFLQDLHGEEKGSGQERETLIRDMHGVPHRFLVTSLAVESTRGFCTLVRLKAAPNGAYAAPVRDFGDLRQMFQNINDPLFTADLGGTITLANPAFYALLEWKEGEPLPNVATLYPSAAELEDKILRLAEADSVTNLETHLRTRSQRPIRVLDTSWVLRDDRGVATGYTTHLKDVTQVKNLEARLKISERNYILLFDTILSSIVIIDPKGQILNCNYSAEMLFGYAWMDIVGKNHSDVFQVQKRTTSIADIIAIVDRNNGHYVETDVPRKCRDGSVKFTYAAYSALTSTTGETLAYAIMERDLTDRVRLEKKLEESFQQIRETQSGAILGFARLTEYRDMDPGKHLERIREYTRVLATGLASLPKYAAYVTPDYIDDLCLSSVLHDVGKVGIEEVVLRKPGRLTPQEFETMKQHARLGGEALKAVDREINRESFLTIGKEIAFSHHERWDGTGYPNGIKGEKIPLSARIVALADVYDALTSRRSYKEAIPHEEAVKIIISESGTHFDPDIVDVFVRTRDTFRRIQLLDAFLENPGGAGELPKAPDSVKARLGRVPGP